jgi:hypothetical protein
MAYAQTEALKNWFIVVLSKGYLPWRTQRCMRVCEYVTKHRLAAAVATSYKPIRRTIMFPWSKSGVREFYYSYRIYVHSTSPLALIDSMCTWYKTKTKRGTSPRSTSKRRRLNYFIAAVQARREQSSSSDRAAGHHGLETRHRHRSTAEHRIRRWPGGAFWLYARI